MPEGKKDNFAQHFAEWKAKPDNWSIDAVLYTVEHIVIYHT